MREKSKIERDCDHTVPGGVTTDSTPTNAHKSRSSVTKKHIIQNNTILACLHFKPAGKKFDSLMSNTHAHAHANTKAIKYKQI